MVSSATQVRDFGGGEVGRIPYFPGLLSFFLSTLGLTAPSVWEKHPEQTITHAFSSPPSLCLAHLGCLQDNLFARVLF